MNKDRKLMMNDLVVVTKVAENMPTYLIGKIGVITKITEEGCYVAADGFTYRREEIRPATRREIKKELINRLYAQCVF